HGRAGRRRRPAGSRAAAPRPGPEPDMRRAAQRARGALRRGRAASLLRRGLSERPRRGLALVVRERTRTVGHDRRPLDAEGDAVEGPAAGRARHALTRLGTIVGAVRGTLHEAPVLGEELVLHPVEAHGDVPAAVHVRMVLAGIVEEEALDLPAVAGDQELLRLAGPELAHAPDHEAHAGTTLDRISRS